MHRKRMFLNAFFIFILIFCGNFCSTLKAFVLLSFFLYESWWLRKYIRKMTSGKMQIWTPAKKSYRQLLSWWMLPNTIYDVTVMSVRKWQRKISFMTSVRLHRQWERYLCWYRDSFTSAIYLSLCKNRF